MKNHLIYPIAILLVLILFSPCSFAKNSFSGPVKIAIKKYKSGNYTGCLQDCQSIVAKDSKNALAYYYMAMSYVQAGKKDDAINNYAQVLNLQASGKLSEYAITGKRCLETPEQCVLEDSTSGYEEFDKFLANPLQGGFSETVKKDIEQKKLNSIKNDINNGKDLDSYRLKNINNFSNKKTLIEAKDNLAENSPNNDEITAALKVLNDARINPYSQNSNYQNPELAQINMLMGDDNQKKNDDNIMNILPFIIAQNSKNEVQSYSPQLMQSIIMNSMMSNFNFDLDKDK